MSMIIVPGQHKADSKPFAELAGDPRKITQAIIEFTKILQQSFRQDAVRYGVDFAKKHNTQTERIRRSKIMTLWYRDLRYSGYGHIQTMDEIPKALRADLDEGNYTPPEKNRLWAPIGVQ